MNEKVVSEHLDVNFKYKQERIRNYGVNTYHLFTEEKETKSLR